MGVGWVHASHSTRTRTRSTHTRLPARVHKPVMNTTNIPFPQIGPWFGKEEDLQSSVAAPRSEQRIQWDGPSVYRLVLPCASCSN